MFGRIPPATNVKAAWPFHPDALLPCHAPSLRFMQGVGIELPIPLLHLGTSPGDRPFPFVVLEECKGIVVGD